MRCLKGGLSVEQPVVGDELRAIERHLATRGDALPWLFPSERGRPLTRQAINCLSQKLLAIPGCLASTRIPCGISAGASWPTRAAACGSSKTTSATATHDNAVYHTRTAGQRFERQWRGT